MLSVALAGRLEPAGADVVRRRIGSVFFLERKNQEIFAHQVPERQATPHLNGQKSFCFFFFRKRRVLCFLPEAVNGCEVYDSLQLRPLLLCPARQAGGGRIGGMTQRWSGSDAGPRCTAADETGRVTDPPVGVKMLLNDRSFPPVNPVRVRE